MRTLKVLLTILLLLPAVRAVADGPLRLAVHPYLAASELIDRFTPLTSYLSRRLGREVALELSSDYAEHIEKIGRNRVEIAYLGPASYVQMIDLYGAKPILARLETNGTPSFRGIVIVRRKAPFTRMADLKGKRFAFGDPRSTMSHLLPRYMLRQAGITLEDLTGYAFLHNHHNVVLGVLLGDFEAGAVKEEVYAEYRESGLRILAETPPIAEHLFVTSSTLPPEMVSALRRLFFELEDSPEGLAVLTAIQADVTGLEPTTDVDYRNLRLILDALGEMGITVE